MQGEFEAAHHLFLESFLILQRIQYQELIPSCLEGLATVAAEQGELVQTAQRRPCVKPLAPLFRRSTG